MEKFIFTFTENHPLRNHYQPVVAESANKARERMNERYGRDWGFQYTEEQAIELGILSNKRELNPMYVKENENELTKCPTCNTSKYVGKIISTRSIKNNNVVYRNFCRECLLEFDSKGRVYPPIY